VNLDYGFEACPVRGLKSPPKNRHTFIHPSKELINAQGEVDVEASLAIPREVTQ
jgi:hypothetical protein